MFEALRTWSAPELAGLLALPFAGLLALYTAGRRQRAGQPRTEAIARSFAEVAMVIGTAPWIWMILTPRPGDGGIELVPFAGLVGVLAGGWSTAVVQVGGNLLVLAAFGAAVPVRWAVGFGRVAGAAAACSALVEVLQCALDLGRVSSVDDILLNTLGAVLGAASTRRWWRRSRKTEGHTVSRPAAADHPKG